MTPKCPRSEKAPIGFSWRKGVRVEGEWKGKEVRTPKSDSPKISPIGSKTAQNPRLSFISGTEQRPVSPLNQTLPIAFTMWCSGGCGVIVGSMFECPGCPENSELISDGTASLDNLTELEMEIL